MYRLLGWPKLAPYAEYLFLFTSSFLNNKLSFYLDYMLVVGHNMGAVFVIVTDIFQ